MIWRWRFMVHRLLCVYYCNSMVYGSYRCRVGTTLVSTVRTKCRRPISTPSRTAASYSTTTMCYRCAHLLAAPSWQEHIPCIQVRFLLLTCSRRLPGCELLTLLSTLIRTWTSKDLYRSCIVQAKLKDSTMGWTCSSDKGENTEFLWGNILESSHFEEDVDVRVILRWILFI